MTLSPTKIIVDAIKDKVSDFDEQYKSIYLDFDMIENSCHATMLQIDDTEEPYPIEDEEITKLKTLFLSKISKAYRISTKDKSKVTRIILVITLDPEKLELFVDSENSENLFQLY